jgi:hypothetical protein
MEADLPGGGELSPGGGPPLTEPRAPYRISSVTLGKFTFDADFDSGNCARVAEVEPYP